jgi:hypothetical protein
MLRCLLWALAAAIQPKALLIADNLCLRQQCSSCPASADTNTGTLTTQGGRFSGCPPRYRPVVPTKVPTKRGGGPDLTGAPSSPPAGCGVCNPAGVLPSNLCRSKVTVQPMPAQGAWAFIGHVLSECHHWEKNQKMAASASPQFFSGAPAV